MPYIKESLGALSNLRYLTLAQSSLYRHTPVLASAISKLSMLIYLNLNSNHIEAKEMQELAPGLKQCHTLQSLFLNHNRLLSKLANESILCYKSII